MSRENTFPPYLEEGSIKGDVKRKHFSSLLRGGFFLTSSPSATAGLRGRAGVGCESIWAVSLAASFCACKQWVGRGQPWFYLRLASCAALLLDWVIRGSIRCPVRLCA